MSRAGPWQKGSFMICDINGLKLDKGDVVAALFGDLRGKVSAVRREDGLGFVCVKAANRPFSKGIWYASDQVQRLQKARPKPEAKPEPKPHAR